MKLLSTHLLVALLCATPAHALKHDDSHKNGGCIGDAHFKTWSGVWYDYRGICDLVLLDNPSFGYGLGLTVHVRTTGKYDGSFVETAAVRIGDDTLEVSSYGEYFFNGVDGARLRAKMGGIYPATHSPHMKGMHAVDENRHHFEIDLLGSRRKPEKIIINTFKDVVSIKFENATNNSFADSVGLLGHFDSGALLARDGRTNLASGHPINAFGQEWRVRESEPRLFQSPSPHQSCVFPSFQADRRRLGEAKVSQEDAELACAHWNESDRHVCVHDVVTMVDLDLAQTQF